MNVVYRFRIYPNKIQQELFAKTFGCVRFVYNRMLAEKKECYEKTGKNLKVTPAKYKAEFPWLKEVDSLALCNAQLHLQTAYKNFFRDPSFGFPKFKSKKNPVKSYTTNSLNEHKAGRRTRFFHKRTICRFQWKTCRLSALFQKQRGKTGESAEKTEPLPEGKQSL